MEKAKKIQQPEFKRGDKVTHLLSEDDNMIGTVTRSLGNHRYLVEFFIEGRQKAGYFTELEFDGKELQPCFIDLEAIKRHSA